MVAYSEFTSLKLLFHTYSSFWVNNNFTQGITGSFEKKNPKSLLKNIRISRPRFLSVLPSARSLARFLELFLVHCRSSINICCINEFIQKRTSSHCITMTRKYVEHTCSLPAPILTILGFYLCC